MARHQLLAGAGLADDQRVGLAGRQALDALQQLAGTGSLNTSTVARTDLVSSRAWGWVMTDMLGSEPGNVRPSCPRNP